MAAGPLNTSTAVTRVVIGKYEFEWSGDRREQALFDSWKAKQDEKPAGTTRQGTRHWPH